MEKEYDDSKKKELDDNLVNRNKLDELKDFLHKLKKIPLAFLVGTIIGISINKSIIMLNSTFLYATTGVPWFEWLNYLFLSIGVLVLPILSLFFLDSVHIRRLLRIYLLIIIFFNIMELIEGIFNRIDSIWMYERSYNVIFILMEVFSAAICWLLLLRQIGGRSLLPIPISTNMYVGYSTIEFMIKNPIKNIIEFITRPKSHNKKLVNTVVIVNLVVFSGLLITMIPENSVITLNRPEHEMRISYWGGENLDNSTLDIIGSRGGRIYAWLGGEWDDESYWERFSSRGVEVFMIDGFDENQSKWEEDFIETAQKMDVLDAQPNNAIAGFVDDMEMLTRIIEFNQSYYDNYVEYIKNKTNYVVSRGYQYHITQWLSSINDYRDGDDEVSVVYENPFNPVEFENLSSIGWMIYRSEMAIKYDEPYDYFAHHWASQVRNYMSYIEEQNDFPDGFWKNKSTVSIGVASDSSLYTFNIKINPEAKQNIMKEIQIYHANEISEVIIFIAGKTNETGGGTDDFFECIGGNDGLNEIYNLLDTYEDVKITYKRRSTFLGNLKMLSNIAGSVFGLFYSDTIYESWIMYLVFLWLAIYIVSFIFISKIKTNRKIVKKIETEFDIISAILRSLFVLVVISIFILTLTFFWWPELFITLQNIEHFLAIFY